MSHCPGKGSVQSSSCVIPVLLGSICLLLTMLRMRSQTNPQDVHLRRLLNPRRSLLPWPSKNADSGGIDYATLLDGLVGRSMHVFCQALKGFVVSCAEEELVLVQVRILATLTSRIPNRSAPDDRHVS